VLREIFPHARFWPPATDAHIEAVEADLGVRLPEQLRRLYLECDGFREDRGNAKYLLSLTEDDFIGSLVQTTRFWWHDWKEYYPRLDLRPFVFFGSSSCDHCWGINWQRPGEIIGYHYDLMDNYEVVGADIIEVYKTDYAGYDGLEQNA
jgi:hypothetical protein